MGQLALQPTWPCLGHPQLHLHLSGTILLPCALNSMLPSKTMTRPLHYQMLSAASQLPLSPVPYPCAHSRLFRYTNLLAQPSWLMPCSVVQDELRHIFQTMDRDKNGRLDVGEFRGDFKPCVPCVQIPRRPQPVACWWRALLLRDFHSQGACKIVSKWASQPASWLSFVMFRLALTQLCLAN